MARRLGFSVQGCTGPLEDPPQEILQPSRVQEFLNRKTDILADLAEEQRRNVSSTMEGDSCGPPIRMPKLLVGSPLPYFVEPECLFR